MNRSRTAIVALGVCLGACSDDSSQQPGTPLTAPTTFKVRVENVAPWTVLASGAQTTKTDGTTGAAGSGQAFEINFYAGKGQSISFATMWGQSDDWFFAPGPAGIALYDANGAPVSGDVTAQVGIWNAGTEIDEEPGVGPDTGPHQTSPTQGAPDLDPTVRAIGATVTLADGSVFMPPAVTDMIKVTLTPGANRQFKLRLENVSTPTTLHTSAGDSAIGFSPVVWALHLTARPNPLFTPGSIDRNQGLEELSESGNVTRLTASMAALTGAATPISPLVVVVHDEGTEPLFSEGEPDRGAGLERLAESGNPAVLSAAVAGSTIVNTPVGASAPGAASPGAAYEFTVSALPGQRLSFATMFGMSDDWFFASPSDGIPLFDADGTPLTADVTGLISIYDAGTEVDELLAIGPDTGPQQSAPDQGQVDPVAQVREVPASSYAHPASAHLRVTLAPQ
jgi:hypothetical protein